MNSTRQLLSEAGGSENAQIAGALRYLSDVIQAQATTFGFKDVFFAIGVVAFLAAGPAWMIGVKRRK
ncbi:MAG: hypothetical protein ACJAU6_003091 [Alphaproteobacteria bacterium]